MDELKQIEEQITAQLRPEDAARVDKLVVAGKQLLYDPSTTDMVFEDISNIGEDSDPRNVAIGVAGLLTLMKQDAKGQFPDELIIPAGALLSIEVVRFLEESGLLDPTPGFVGNLIEEFLAASMQKLGMGGPQQAQPQQPQQVPQQADQQAQAAPRGILSGAA